MKLILPIHYILKTLSLRLKSEDSAKLLIQDYILTKI